MDTELMKKMGWDQELIDSFNKLRRIIDDSAVKCEPSSRTLFHTAQTLESTSINTSHYLPAGQSRIIVEKVQRKKGKL